MPSLEYWKKVLPPEMFEQVKEKYGQIDNYSSGSASDLESVVVAESVGAKTDPRFNSPVCLSFHSIRGRLADTDGVSGKAAIDGLVKAGILSGDRQENIKEIRHSQEKGWPEKTIIKIKIA